MTINELKLYNKLCKHNKVIDLVHILSTNYQHLNILSFFEQLIDDYQDTFREQITIDNNLVLEKQDFLFFDYIHKDYLPFVVPTLDSLFNDALPFIPNTTKKYKHLPLKTYNILKQEQKKFAENLKIPFYKKAGDIVYYTFDRQQTLNFILNFINFHESVIHELMYLGCKHLNISLSDFNICTPKDIISMIEIEQKYEQQHEQ